MKVAIIGRTGTLYDTAKRLAEAGHEIKVIITAKAAPEYTKTEYDFKELAGTFGASFLMSYIPLNLEGVEAEEICRGLDIGVSINYPSIIEEGPISWFKHGILNAHLGDLPKYRGNACASWAILNGEKEVLTSIHKMEPGALDCGRIIHQGAYTLNEQTTIGDIREWFRRSVPGMFGFALAKLEHDPNHCEKFAMPAAPEAFRCYPRMPVDGFIDWWNTGIKFIHRLIRASGPPFEGAYTHQIVDGQLKKLIILESYIIRESCADQAICGQVLSNNREQTGESWIRCGLGILAITKCRYSDEPEPFQPGKRWKSIRMRLGVRPEDMIFQLMEERNK